jgi:hypothetical protein
MKNKTEPVFDFSDLTVVIKTFIRYGVLKTTVDSLSRFGPTLKIHVVDDTPLEHRKFFDWPNVKFIHTDPDIGLCDGRNIGFASVTTPYLLYTDDDAPCRMTPEELLRCLNIVRDGHCDILGWKGFTMEDTGSRVVITRRDVTHPGPFDVTENAFIAKRQTMLDHPQISGLKINGEHFAMFVKWKRAGVVVWSSPDMKFANLRTRNRLYNKWRNRSFRHLARREVGTGNAKWIDGRKDKTV